MSLPANSQSSLYRPIDDQLPMRDSNSYARYKLKAIETYLKIVGKAMYRRPWRERIYVDLMSGPGKNRIDNEILIGSPLISLTIPQPFTEYIFNEPIQELNNALVRRINAHPMGSKAKVYQDSAEVIVDKVCRYIQQIDKQFIPGKHPSFNVAFLDPEGISELPWSIIEKLGEIRIMDLIILFSTSGLIRSISKGYDEVVNNFFGTTEWQKGYDPNSTATEKRRYLIDFYLKRLQSFNYKTTVDPERAEGTDIPFKNSRNVQVYSLIFASKHKLGYKLWQETKKHSLPPKLPGFE